MSTIELKVKGMTCPHCEMRVRKALEAVEGVQSVKADHKAGKATVTLKPGAGVDKKKLVDAVNDTELYTAEA
jgi:copper chaperone CopZ